MRVTPLYDLDEFDKQLHQWCREAAGEDGYKIKWIQRFHAKNLTSVEKGNKWWDAFSSVMDGFGAKLIKTIFPGLNTLTHSRHFKASPDPNHFSSEINVGKRQIRH